MVNLQPVQEVNEDENLLQQETTGNRLGNNDGDETKVGGGFKTNPLAQDGFYDDVIDEEVLNDPFDIALLNHGLIMEGLEAQEREQLKADADDYFKQQQGLEQLSPAQEAGALRHQAVLNKQARQFTGPVPREEDIDETKGESKGESTRSELDNADLLYDFLVHMTINDLLPPSTKVPVQPRDLAKKMAQALISIDDFVKKKTPGQGNEIDKLLDSMNDGSTSKHDTLTQLGEFIYGKGIKNVGKALLINKHGNRLQKDEPAHTKAKRYYSIDDKTAHILAKIMKAVPSFSQIGLEEEREQLIQAITLGLKGKNILLNTKKTDKEGNTTISSKHYAEHSEVQEHQDKVDNKGNISQRYIRYNKKFGRSKQALERQQMESTIEESMGEVRADGRDELNRRPEDDGERRRRPRDVDPDASRRGDSRDEPKDKEDDRSQGKGGKGK